MQAVADPGRGARLLSSRQCRDAAALRAWRSSPTKQGDPAGFVAITIVVAQGTMILASLIAMRMAKRKDIGWCCLISFVALPIRGVIAACCDRQMGRLSGPDP